MNLRHLITTPSSASGAPAPGHSSHRRLLHAVAVAPVIAGALAVLPSAASAATSTYQYSPNYQQFTVPAGVSSVHAVVDGGSGADGQGSFGVGAGAPGGQVTADLPVTGGEVLTLWVGGAGQPGGGAGYGNPTHDNFGGGSGGGSYGPGAGSGGGGGAASYIKVNGSILALGGGGGGGGGSGSPMAGGSAGGGASGGGYALVQDEYPGYGNAFGGTNAAADGQQNVDSAGKIDGGSSNGGSGTSGGNGIQFGGGGGGGGGGFAVCDPADFVCVSAGGGGLGGSFSSGGGGGAGGNSYADPSLTGVAFDRTGLSSGSAGQITLSYGSASVTSVNATAQTIAHGQSVSFHAFVEPTDGGGTVSFASNGSAIPGCTGLSFVSGGGDSWEVGCTTSALPAGDAKITATYSGDAQYAPSSDNTEVTVQVTAPGAPTGVSATAGDTNAAVSFTAPADNGGSAITGYTVTATDHTNPANGGQTATGSGAPITVDGLTDGDAYTFTVTAANASATGATSSASNTVVPHTSLGTGKTQLVPSCQHPTAAQQKKVAKNEPITLSCTLVVKPAPQSSGAPVPSGTVSFSSSDPAISFAAPCSLPATAGVADKCKVKLTTSTAHSYPITARYSGDRTYAANMAQTTLNVK